MIATLSEVKTELGIPAADTKDDAVLTQWLTGLEGRFESYLDRSLSRLDDDVEYHSGGMFWLHVRRWPIESVASIHISAAQVWDASSLLPADYYRVDPLKGRIHRVPDAFWPAGSFGSIRVVFTGGYVAGGTLPSSGQYGMPDAIRRAFMMQLGFEWRNRLNLGKANVSAQGASIGLAPAKLLPETQDILNVYKHY